MGPCSLFWVCAIICMIAFKPYVYCGPCTRTEDCVGTDSTTATCETSTKQCTCNAGYGPIRTGCGLKLTKPTVNIEGERGPYLFTGTTGNLSCSTTPGAVSYNWYQGGAKVGSSQTLTISAAGAYTCQAISDTTSLNSDVSDPVNVAVIGGGTSDTPYRGTLIAGFKPSGSSIFTAKSVTLFCTGVPMGYTGVVNFMDGGNGQLVSSAASSLSVTYAISTNPNGLTCTLPTTNKVTFATSPNSVVLPSPNSAIVINSATLSAKDSNGDITSGTTYNVGAVGLTLTCTTDPVPEFLDSSKPIQYEFKDGSNSKKIGNSNTYTVDTSKASTGSYLCTATYDSVTKNSATFSIDVSTGFILDPVLTKVGTTGLTIGSTLVLSCGATQGDSTTSYIWLINDIIIAGQIDWKIQLYNFTEADIGLYKCRALKSRYMTALSSFPAIMKPTVTRVTSGTIYAEGGDYVLKCNTGSNVTVGWTYLWKKGANDTSIKTDTYTITNAKGATHNGTYTCTSTYNGASGTSDPITVAVEAPGKRCTGDTECTGTGFSGKCITTTDPKVCECSANYILKGETCASGAAALISCVLMVVMASLWSVFF